MVLLIDHETEPTVMPTGRTILIEEDKLTKIAAKMTPEQIEEAKAFAQEWKASHPPLSFFPDKLGF